VILVVASTALGALVTVLTGTEPGTVLSVFLIAGTAAAVLAVRPGAVYLIIPLPALAYVVAAAVAGLIHDQATGTSRTALAVGAAQWAASGFLAMAAATVLAIAAAAARWPGRGRDPQGPGRAPPATRARRPGHAPAPRRPGRGAGFRFPDGP
jgi:hypothetical protein